MEFIEFIAVIGRHRLLVCAGLILACVAAVLSAYSLEGAKLVGRSQPVYEMTAVVVIKPGGEIPPLPTTSTTAAPTTSTTSTTSTTTTTTTTVAPSTSALIALGTAVPTSTVPSPTTTTNPPPATTSPPTPTDVIDSRGLYYAALSIQTAIVAPGFAETVRDVVPDMDGSIDAVVALDTNTIRIVVDGSTPSRAVATMDGTLAQLGPMVDSYAFSHASRFTLEAEVISGPSTPSAVSSIKGPLTMSVVFGVAVVMLWLSLRAFDVLQLHRRESDQLQLAKEAKAESGYRELEQEAQWRSPP